MKILICISQLTRGGAERVVANLSNYLCKEHDVTLAIFRKRKIEYELNEKIKLFELEEEKNKNKNKILKNIYRYKKLYEHLRTEKYDVILTFLPEPSFYVLSLKNKLNLNVIVSVRNDPKVEYKKLIYKLLMKIFYIRANGFVFQTNEAKEYFCDEIQNKSRIIMNSVNSEFINFNKEIDERKNTIVNVGRLSNQKNQKLLINAFAKFSKKHEEYELVIYGDGEKRTELEELVKELNMNAKIKLPGIENDIISKIYDAKMFILSSNYEGMPNALIEAMALGIPVISTDCPCGGPKELILDGENGFLVEVNNEEMLLKMMLKLAEDADLQLKFSNYKNEFRDRVNPNIINEEWENFLKSSIK